MLQGGGQDQNQHQPNITNHGLNIDFFHDAIFHPDVDIDDSFTSTEVQANAHWVQHKDIDLQKLQKKFGFLPLRILEHTVRYTTQISKAILRFPMRRHIKDRFPFLNRIRLREVVATDTMFSNCRAIGGYTCAQVFYGLT